MSVCVNVNIVSNDKYFIPKLMNYEIIIKKKSYEFITEYKWHSEI